MFPDLGTLMQAYHAHDAHVCLSQWPSFMGNPDHTEQATLDGLYFCLLECWRWNPGPLTPSAYALPLSIISSPVTSFWKKEWRKQLSQSEWQTGFIFKHQGNTVRHCYSFFGKWSCTNHMRKVMWSEKYVVETSSPEWQSSRYAAEVRARNTEPSWRTAEQ